MACIDLPSADHEDASETLISQRTSPVVIPTPQLALRHEQEHAFEGDLTPDDEGHIPFHLPVFVRVEVFPEEESTECFLIATKNKRGFGHGGDGLTVYGSVDRTSFTFRTNVFDSFPPGLIRHTQVRLRRREWNEMALAIAEHQATYWINGVPVATCRLEDADLPSKRLFLGLTRYAHDYRFRRFDVSRDPAVLSVFSDRVLTLLAAMEGGTLRVRCLGVSGSEVAALEAAGATELLPDTEVAALREIIAHPCAQRGARMVVDDTVKVRLRPGPVGHVWRRFDGGAVALSAPDSARSAGVPAKGLLRFFCRRRAMRGGYLFVPTGEAAALQAQGGERLGEFRARVAAAVGVLTPNLKLALPDGTFLPESQDSQALQSLLQPSSGGAA
mmetsp:Transcript_16586/g.52030  ORF Transcript_16586/g.52030 Transcript_16586/m.52030 type:complete len:387 (+) Transcript_16586:43-1203(+)